MRFPLAKNLVRRRPVLAQQRLWSDASASNLASPGTCHILHASVQAPARRPSPDGGAVRGQTTPPGAPQTGGGGGWIADASSWSAIVSLRPCALTLARRGLLECEKNVSAPTRCGARLERSKVQLERSKRHGAIPEGDRHGLGRTLFRRPCRGWPRCLGDDYHPGCAVNGAARDRHIRAASASPGEIQSIERDLS
jgi:hypothetical protein